MKHGQRGLTLIELMVSVVLAMLIAIALLTLLVNVNRNNTELARTNSVIENGRFSLQLLEADVSHGGFWGGYVPTFDSLSSSAMPGANSGSAVLLPTSVPDPCTAVQPALWTADYKAQLIAIPMQVYQVDSAGVADACATLITSAQAQPNTDILVVRHAALCAAGAAAGDPDSGRPADHLFFQLSRCAGDAATYVLSPTAAELILRNGTCGLASTVATTYCVGATAPTNCAPMYRFVSTVYWVRNYFVTVGDGIPTLVRSRFQLSGGTLAHTNTETLVDGIQAFRVQLGVDNVSKPTVSGGTGVTLTSASFASTPTWALTTTMYTPTNRGDGNADTYITCATGTGANACYDDTDATTLAQTAFNLANAVAVKLYVLARASSTTPGYTDAKKYCLGGSTANCDTTNTSLVNKTMYGPFSDGYKRHVYTQTVRLVNVSMRREVPTTQW